MNTSRNSGRRSAQVTVLLKPLASMFSQDLDTTRRSNEFCILAEFQVRSPTQSPQFVAPLNNLGGISYRAVQHNGQGSTRFECPVEKRGRVARMPSRRRFWAPRPGVGSCPAVRFLRNLLMSSFESTNRSRQVSGTSDASKTRSVLIRQWDGFGLQYRANDCR